MVVLVEHRGGQLQPSYRVYSPPVHLCANLVFRFADPYPTLTVYTVSDRLFGLTFPCDTTVIGSFVLVCDGLLTHRFDVCTGFAGWVCVIYFPVAARRTPLTSDLLYYKNAKKDAGPQASIDLVTVDSVAVVGRFGEVSVCGLDITAQHKIWAHREVLVVVSGASGVCALPQPPLP